MPNDVLKDDLGLVKRELSRLEDFSSDALNYSNSLEIKDKINEVYGNLLYELKEDIVE